MQIVAVQILFVFFLFFFYIDTYMYLLDVAEE